jgi:hypothetical protein
MKRKKPTRKRKAAAQAELEQLASTVRYAQALIETDDVDALTEDSETCAALIRAVSAQEQLFYVVLAQNGQVVQDRRVHNRWAQQTLVIGDLVQRAFALGLREGRGEIAKPEAPRESVGYATPQTD